MLGLHAVILGCVSQIRGFEIAWFVALCLLTFSPLKSVHLHLNPRTRKALYRHAHMNEKWVMQNTIGLTDAQTIVRAFCAGLLLKMRFPLPPLILVNAFWAILRNTLLHFKGNMIWKKRQYCSFIMTHEWNSAIKLYVQTFKLFVTVNSQGWFDLLNHD